MCGIAGPLLLDSNGYLGMSIIYDASIRKLPKCFPDDFTDSGVGEDDLLGILHTKLQLDHLSSAPNDFAAVGADHVHAENGTPLLID